MRTLAQRSNYCGAAFLVSLLFLVLSYCLGQATERPGSGFLLALFSILALGSLGAWAWFAFQNGRETLAKLMSRDENY